MCCGANGLQSSSGCLVWGRFLFLALFVVGLLVALLVGRWFRRHGDDPAQGGREVQWYNSYGRLELIQLGKFVVLRCAVCGQTFLQVGREDGRAQRDRPKYLLPLKALQHQCAWIKTQTHKASKRQLKIGRHG